MDRFFLNVDYGFSFQGNAICFDTKKSSVSEGFLARTDIFRCNRSHSGASISNLIGFWRHQSCFEISGCNKSSQMKALHEKACEELR